MVRNIAMCVAYDGTEFYGWQDQPELRTVQSVLEQAVRRAVRHQVSLTGSGRTDRGVHAAGHVSSFPTTNCLPVERLQHSIGARLPKDISIVSLRDVRADFHATRSATSKLYRYRIYNTAGRPVEIHVQQYAYHFWHHLDVDRMREAARLFVGTQDFAAMAGKGAPRQTTVRTVLRCDVERHFDEVRIDVEGDGFLYKQVRNMAGTLIAVGRGQWEPQRVSCILDSRDRANAGATAPARGLCLQWVRYPAEVLRPDPACRLGLDFGALNEAGASNAALDQAKAAPLEDELVDLQ
jgi:tRNA pseudouridine38-40 synthase